MRRPPQPKPPAFMFYVRDWILSTLGMPHDVKGAFIDLLAWAWDNGPLPDDPAWRQCVLGVPAPEAERLWAAMLPRWKKTTRGWLNRRLERQRGARVDYSARARKAANTRWNRARAAATTDASSNASSIAKRMLRGTLDADVRALLERSISFSSSSSDQEQPAAPPPVSPPPFKTYCAIAALAVDEAQTDDLGAIAEVFKVHCARQRIPYGADITRKAIDAVIRSRARRRA